VPFNRGFRRYGASHLTGECNVHSLGDPRRVMGLTRARAAQNRMKCAPFLARLSARPGAFTNLLNLLNLQRMCRHFARLSRICRLKGSPKFAQMQPQNSKSSAQRQSGVVLTDCIVSDARSGRRVYIRVLSCPFLNRAENLTAARATSILPPNSCRVCRRILSCGAGFRARRSACSLVQGWRFGRSHASRT
jgi:hypothetical protein